MQVRAAMTVLALCVTLGAGEAMAGSTLAPLPGPPATGLEPLLPVPPPIIPPPIVQPASPGVIDRPEIRSYQPYSTLQYGFRPDPPVQRGVQQKRPRVVMPKRLAPLIPYGSPPPYTEEWYVYCADRYRSFEPRTGLYTAFSGEKRLCR